ncbi:hypothetical protein [Streptomyces himalayensis]|uniref:hypothetical protein n=1 Tax=Streptomyces himalayensis TaxID=2820085 RepID=UPI001FE9B253|nr:hypothetical protein [Streptomyces himalayensis]
MIRDRVQVWSGQPCATGPLANSCSSTANSSSLSSGNDAGPLEARNLGPSWDQTLCQRCTDRTLTRR